jgi:hypothetical protein
VDPPKGRDMAAGSEWVTQKYPALPSPSYHLHECRACSIRSPRRKIPAMLAV